MRSVELFTFIACPVQAMHIALHVQSWYWNEDLAFTGHRKMLLCPWILKKFESVEASTVSEQKMNLQQNHAIPRRKKCTFTFSETYNILYKYNHVPKWTYTSAVPLPSKAHLISRTYTISICNSPDRWSHGRSLTQGPGSTEDSVRIFAIKKRSYHISIPGIRPGYLLLVVHFLQVGIRIQEIETFAGQHGKKYNLRHHVGINASNVSLSPPF